MRLKMSTSADKFVYNAGKITERVFAREKFERLAILHMCTL